MLVVWQRINLVPVISFWLNWKSGEYTEPVKMEWNLSIIWHISKLNQTKFYVKIEVEIEDMRADDVKKNSEKKSDDNF